MDLSKLLAIDLYYSYHLLVDLSLVNESFFQCSEALCSLLIEREGGPYYYYV